MRRFLAKLRGVSPAWWWRLLWLALATILLVHYRSQTRMLGTISLLALGALAIVRHRRASAPFDFFQFGGDLCLVINSQGKIVKANEVSEKYFEIPRAKLCSMEFMALLDPEDRYRAKSVLREIENFDQPLEFDTGISGGGTPRWASWIGMAHPSRKWIFLVGRDITFKKLATDELFESEGRYRMVVDNSREIIFRHDGQGRILFLNSAFEQLTGFSAEDSTGTNFSEFVDGDDLEGRRALLRKLVHQRKQYGQYEFGLKCANGRIRHVESNFRVNFDAEGNIVDVVGAITDITEKRAAERAVRAERDFTEAVVETVGALVIVFDRDRRILKFNRAAQELLGYTFEEVKGKDYVHLFVEPNRAESSRQRFASFFHGDKIQSFETQWITKGGDQRFIRWQVSTVTDAEGEIQTIINTGVDVTDIRSAEANLKKSQERFELAVLGSSDGLWDWDIAAGELYYAPRWKEMLGYEDGELPTTPDLFDQLVHPEDREYVDRTLSDYLSGGTEVYKCEFRMRHKSGEYRWILARGIAIRREDGAACRMAGSHTDITERVAADQALRYKEICLEEAQRMAKLGSWEYDSVNDQATWSEEMFRLLGLEPSKSPLTSADTYKYIHPDDLNRVLGAIKEAVVQKSSFITDYRIVRADGSILYVNATGRPITDEHGDVIGLVGTLQDITERKLFEHELVDAREAALESIRLKSEFLTNMSHEIRTPLNGVIGMADLLAGSNLDEEQAGYAQTIRQCAETLLSMLSNILDLSDIRRDNVALKIEEFNLGSVLAEVASAHEIAAKNKGLDLEVTASAKLSDCYMGDRGRIKQVLDHLVSNAVKFTEQGSIRIDARPSSTGVRIEVRDTGIGIPPERHSKIFETFSQGDGSTTRRFGGAGVGLAIVRQVTELIGGSIGLRSKPGKGSTFWIELPLGSVAQAGQAKAEPVLALEKPVRVLLAAKDGATRKTILARLIQQGAKVDLANDASQCSMMSNANRYDFLFIDGALSIPDGPAWISRLRNAETESGHRTRFVGIGMLGKELGDYMDEHLDKASTEEQIWNALQHAPASGAAFDFAHLGDLSGGDIEFEKEVVGTFLDTMPEMVSELTQAMAEGQKDSSLRLAHTLKGSSRSVGATELGDIFQSIEEQVRADGTPHVTVISEAIARFRKAADSYFAKKAA